MLKRPESGSSALPILKVVEKRLKERFHNLKLSYYFRDRNVSVAETGNLDEYEEWVKQVDAVILFAGD